MSSDEEDLFADSSSGDDTNELISEAAKKKKLAPKRLSSAKPSSKKNTKKAYESDEEAKALFDSDSEDEKRAPPPRTKVLDKKSRMAALQAKRRDAQTASTSKVSSNKKGEDTSSRKEGKKKSSSRNKNKGEEDDDKGYDSGDSYDSGVFIRTKEDDDFIDDDDEDPEALKELYAEQHFDDERGYDMSEVKKKKASSSSSSAPQHKKRSRSSGPDALSDDDEVDEKGEPKNPIMAVVQRMKKKKKEVKKLEELEEQAAELVRRMMDASEEDEAALKQMRTSTKKLVLLPEVLNIMTQRDMWRPLLDGDVLIAIGAWIQPLPNGSLGNVTVRHKLIDAIGKMTGEKGVTTDDLKKSGFGKVLMKLYMHKDETAEMKRLMKSIMDSWSRPIFQKSENLRDLDTVLSHSRRGDTGIVGISKALSQEKNRGSLDGGNVVRSKDLSTILSKGSKAEEELGSNRVRVPYSKGFQYTVRPSNLTGDVSDKLTRAVSVKDSRESLHKRMIQKTRPVAKNQRSAGLSIEGRPIK